MSITSKVLLGTLAPLVAQRDRSLWSVEDQTGTDTHVLHRGNSVIGLGELADRQPLTTGEFHDRRQRFVGRCRTGNPVRPLVARLWGSSPAGDTRLLVVCLLGVVSVVGGFLLFAGPETRNRRLEDVSP